MAKGRRAEGTGPEDCLAGRRIVVTRPRAQADDFVRAIEERGGEAIVAPMIRIEPPVDATPLRHAAASVGEYDWIVFTSVNGVDHFWRELDAAGRTAEDVSSARIACIGPATAAMAEERGVHVDVVPPKYVAESLAEVLERAAGGAAGLEGRRMLLPRAAAARAVLREELAASGARVDEVPAYRAVLDGEGAERVRRLLAEDAIDAVTFTSSSTVENFSRAVGTTIGRALVAAIGPITAATARRHDLTVHIEATEHTIPGLASALCEHFRTETEADSGV